MRRWFRPGLELSLVDRLPLLWRLRSLRSRWRERRERSEPMEFPAVIDTPELADEYGRLAAKYCDEDGRCRGEARDLLIVELWLTLEVGGPHELSDEQVRQLAEELRE